MYYNGRIASNFINGIVESFPSQIVLDLFNAATNILIYVGIWSLCNEKRRFCGGAVFFTALVLLMSPQMRKEVLFCANGAYVVPVLLIPVYFVLLDRLEKDADHAARITAWMCLVCFMICTWTEHIAVGFGVLLSFSQNRKLLFGILILCCFSLLPMLFTPNQAPRVANIGFWGIVCCTIVLFVEIRSSGGTAQRVLSLLSTIVIILSLDQTILLTRRIHTVQEQREAIIEEVRMRQALGEWDYDENVILSSFKENDILQTQRQAGSYHYIRFLDYYGLDRCTRVIFEEY